MSDSFHERQAARVLVSARGGSVIIRSIAAADFPGGGGGDAASFAAFKEAAESGDGVANKKAIKKFTRASGRNMRHFLATSEARYNVLLTLTYPGVYAAGKEAKEHLKKLCEWMVNIQKFQKNYGASVFWVLEYQKRGAPHFHLLLNFSIDKDWVAEKWFKIVGSGDTRHLYAGTRIEYIKHGRGAIISYISKYMSKSIDETAPEQHYGRFWGVYGNRGVVSASIICDKSGRAAHEIKNEIKEALKIEKAVLSVNIPGRTVYRIADYAVYGRMCAKIRSQELHGRADNLHQLLDLGDL